MGLGGEEALGDSSGPHPGCCPAPSPRYAAPLPSEPEALRAGRSRAGFLSGTSTMADCFHPLPESVGANVTSRPGSP